MVADHGVVDDVRVLYLATNTDEDAQKTAHNMASIGRKSRDEPVNPGLFHLRRRKA